jgi:thioredoxin 1
LQNAACLSVYGIKIPCAPLVEKPNGRKIQMALFLTSFSKEIISINKIKGLKMALEFTDAAFKADVLDNDKLTVVDFWAEWCGPCRAIGPIIEDLSKEYAGKVQVGKLNVDHNPEVSINYGITSIPAILFFKNGQMVDKLVGAQPKGNFVKKIEQHM